MRFSGLQSPTRSADVAARSRQSVAALERFNFRLYFGGQIISMLGSWMQITAQIWLVLEVTGNGGKLGLAAALQFLPSLVLGPWVGVIADRFDNRLLLLVTNSVAGLVALGLGLLSIGGGLTLFWLYAAALAIGTSNAFDRAAGPAFVSSLVGPGELSSAIGLYSVTTSASRMVGTAVAGVVISEFGATPCFLINAGSYLFVLASLLSLRTSEIAERRKGGGPVRILDGWLHVRSRPILARTLLITTAVGMFGMNFMMLVPAMVKLVFHAEARWFGIAEVFSGAGSTVAGFVVGSLRRPSARSVGAVAAALGGVTVVTGLAPNLWLFSFLMFGVGLTAVGFMTASMTVTQANADPDMRGRVAALQGVAQAGTMPIGALLAGQCIDIFNVRTALVLAGLSAVVGGFTLIAAEKYRPSAHFDSVDQPAESAAAVA